MPGPQPRPYIQRGIDVRPGSVRIARLAAGLSMSQLAGAELSKTAILLIEQGRSRPSLATLRLIASRTGKPAEFFLPDGAKLPDDGESEARRLAGLETLSLEGEFHAVIREAPAIIAETVDGIRRTRATIMLARAHCLLGDYEVAITHSRAARELAEAARDPFLAADALAWEGGALMAVSDPRASVVLVDALAECRKLPAPDGELEARILTNLATWYVSKSDWKAAIESYEAAVRASEQTRNLGMLARMYVGLAQAYEGRGEAGRADRLVERALAIHHLTNNIAAEVRTRSDYAELLCRNGRIEEAEVQAQEARRLFQTAGMAAGERRMLLLAAEVALGKDRPSEALELVAEASAISEPVADAQLDANLVRLRGLARAASGDRYEDDLIDAIQRFGAIGLLERSQSVRRELAERLERDGRLQEALRHWKLAAGATAPQSGSASGADNIVPLTG